MTLTLDESFLLNLPLMNRPAAKGKITQLDRSRLAHRSSCMRALRPARASGPATSYLQTRVRASRLYEAAFILAIAELTRRLHQAYRQAYDKQAAEQLLPQNPGPNVDDLGRRITNIVSNSKCADFIRDLINKAAELTGNPAASNSALTLFGTIKSQGGFVYGDTVKRAYGFEGGTVHGSISGGNA
ncbi:MAG: hypothetical protein LC776_10220, partial [Acidobacteria bacterium]|nr:hypothetical protein [Acidobacteriota bacterium]